MHKFQSFIKNTRESRNLTRETVADAINLSVETIEIIEEGENNVLLLNSSSVLKNQVRRYCEYLEVPEKQIVSILNKIDLLYYKKSRYGKLKLFDYINRLAIITVAIAIIILVVKHVKNNLSYNAPKNSKDAIIYTPIQYDMDDSNQQQTNDTEENKGNLQENNNIENNNIESIKSNHLKQLIESENDNSNNIDNSQSNEQSKDLVAHPPSTANLNNFVIDDDNSDQEQNNTETTYNNLQSNNNIDDSNSDNFSTSIENSNNSNNNDIDNSQSNEKSKELVSHSSNKENNKFVIDDNNSVQQQENTAEESINNLQTNDDIDTSKPDNFNSSIENEDSDNSNNVEGSQSNETSEALIVKKHSKEHLKNNDKSDSIFSLSRYF